MRPPLSETGGRSTGQLPRSLTILLTLAAAVGVVAGMRAISDTLGPAFLAVVLVVSLHPVQAGLQRRGAPAWVGVLALLLTIYAILLGLAASLVLSIAQLAVLLPSYEPQFRHLIGQLAGLLAALGIERDEIRSTLDQLDLSHFVGVLRALLGGIRTVLSDISFMVVLIFFLAVDAAHLSDRLDAAAHVHPRVVAALHSFAGATRRYVVVSTVFGLVVAVVDVGALVWLAIPLPLLWGLLAFITNYIPNVGFVLGLIPPALLGLLGGGVGRMVGVVVAYSVINFVIQSLLQPKVVGNAVGMSVTLTFLSLVFWAFVIGPLGALLAVPLSLLVKALLIDADPASQWLRPLLGDVDGGSPARESAPVASRVEAASPAADTEG